MEKGPEENNKLTNKEIGCVLAGGVAIIALFSTTIPFQKNQIRVDNAILYGIPGFYGTVIIAMIMYDAIVKNK